MKILDYFTGKLERNVKDLFRDFLKDSERFLNRKVHYYKKMIFKELVAVSVILISIVFLVLAILFALMEYLHFNKTISF